MTEIEKALARFQDTFASFFVSVWNALVENARTFVLVYFVVLSTAILLLWLGIL